VSLSPSHTKFEQFVLLSCLPQENDYISNHSNKYPLLFLLSSSIIKIMELHAIPQQRGPGRPPGDNKCPRCRTNQRSGTGYCKPCRKEYQKDRRLRAESYSAYMDNTLCACQGDLKMTNMHRCLRCLVGSGHLPPPRDPEAIEFLEAEPRLEAASAYNRMKYPHSWPAPFVVTKSRTPRSEHNDSGVVAVAEEFGIKRLGPPTGAPQEQELMD
jgi:hypothetical protein